MSEEGIKRLDQEEEYTPEQVRELFNCKKDLFHFLKQVVIVHPDRGRVVFDPWEYQTELFQLINDNRFVVALVARQQGKSVMVAAYLLWYSLFNKDKKVGVVSNNEEGAIDILDRIKVMYEELPDYLKPGIKEYNKKTITFENNTQIRARATSKDSFRGRTLNICFADEFAFVDPQWKADEFFTSNWPTISASTESKFIIVSTPKGIGNIFHNIYDEAERGLNTFKPFYADWSAHPDRDPAWAEEQKKNLGTKRFNQEFGCSFIGSDTTLLDESNLKRLLAQEVVDPITTILSDTFRIYEKPKQGSTYIMGVDSSDGTGKHFSTIQMFELISISPIKMKQVATYEDNNTDIYKFSEYVNQVSLMYNNAYMMVENNNMGSTVVNQLWWEYENESLICEGTKEAKLGIRATKKTKPIAVLLMKKLIEDESIDIVDYRTIQQFLTFLDTGNSKYSGNGNPDDLISAFYWAVYFFKFDILEDTMTFRKDEADDDWGIFGSNEVEDDGYEVLQY